MVKETVSEARNVVRSAMERLDKRILSKSAELKPRIVSIASRLYDILGYIDAILGGVESNIGEEAKHGKTLSFGTFFYVALYKDSFVIVRSKPYTISVSYRRGEGKLYVRTRNFKAVISPTTLELSKLAMSLTIDLGSINDFVKNITEIRYLMKSFGRIIEYQLLPVAEKRLGLKL